MKRHHLIPALLVLLLAPAVGCGSDSRSARGAAAPPTPDVQTPAPENYGQVLVTNRLDIDFSKHAVTFIELGADRCIPCKAMQPVMREIAKEYAEKIQVVFYDVWKDPAPARKYGIQLIPTQVFIDRGGKEIHRHVGFYAKEEIRQMLKEKGIL